MAVVRDYVPLYAVIAHRGFTYWAPEETESAWRWAREMGVDYLESDLQYMIDHGLRGRSDIPNPFHPGSTYDNSQASRIVPDAVKTLERLGYLYRSSNLCHIAARNGE